MLEESLIFFLEPQLFCYSEFSIIKSLWSTFLLLFWLLWLLWALPLLALVSPLMRATVPLASVGNIYTCLLGILDIRYTNKFLGTRYTDATTGQSGCCPLGTVYQPAACAPGTPTTTNPTCPADDGKLYLKNGFTYKVYCDVTTNLGPDGTLFPRYIEVPSD